MMGSMNRKYTFEHLAESDSTNLHASDLLSARKIVSPHVISTEFQRKGKGQGLNKWESQAGMNLLMSVVVFPANIIASEQFYLSKIASIAVRELLSGITKSNEPKIKWPNDILYGKEKISGILIENVLAGDIIKNSIIGIGINVNQTEFESFSPRAVSLKMITGNEIQVLSLREELVKIFDYWFGMMESRDFGLIDRTYMGYLYGLFELRKFRSGDTTFIARITEVEADGKLVLQTEDNKKFKFLNKEVSMMME
jgi:BirA family transcriptional regulator, biotin operon repressor / biotin---[acetyl-CoA-carboxylase] ligase